MVSPSQGSACAAAGWGAPLNHTVPRSSTPVEAQTWRALSPAHCSPERLWPSCVATWSPRKCHCGSPWGRPGHGPGMDRVRGRAWTRMGSWVGQLQYGAWLTPELPTPAPSGHGSRRCPPTCPSSTVAGSHLWMCCRRLPGRWRDWRLPQMTRSEPPESATPPEFTYPATANHCPCHPEQPGLPQRCLSGHRTFTKSLSGHLPVPAWLAWPPAYIKPAFPTAHPCEPTIHKKFPETQPV